VSSEIPQLPEGRLPSEASLVERPFETTAELRIRHSELKSISERLDHVAATSRAPKWERRYQMALGATGAGIIGLIPFLVSRPSLIAEGIYAAVLAVALFLSRQYSNAARDVSAERADSVLAIKEHIDNTMLTTETPRLQAPTTARRIGPRPPSPAEAPGAPPQTQAPSPQPGSHGAD
jgi:hypothetical protein